jgi:hypothetical protein
MGVKMLSLGVTAKVFREWDIEGHVWNYEYGNNRRVDKIG